VKPGSANCFRKTVVSFSFTFLASVAGELFLFPSSAFLMMWPPPLVLFIFILSAGVALLSLWRAHDAESSFHFDNGSLLLVFVPALKFFNYIPVHIQCIFQEIALEATENVASFIFLFFPSSPLFSPSFHLLLLVL